MSIDLELKKLSFFHYDAEKNDGNRNKAGLITLVKIAGFLTWTDS